MSNTRNSQRTSSYNTNWSITSAREQQKHLPSQFMAVFFGLSPPSEKSGVHPRQPQVASLFGNTNRFSALDAAGTRSGVSTQMTNPSRCSSRCIWSRLLRHRRWHHLCTWTRRWQPLAAEYLESARSDLVTHNDRVYVGGFSGTVSALNASDGSVAWSYTLPGQISASLAIDDSGTVIIGCQDRSVYAIRDGALLWSASTGGRYGERLLLTANAPISGK